MLNTSMTTNLEKALEFAKYRATINNQHTALKAKTEALLSYSVNGGTFTIDRELISFVHCYCTDGKGKALVMLDIYNNPIKIDDLPEFLSEITSRYAEVTNDYHAEYQKLRKARKVHKVLDLNVDGE
jgi:hypothetical protein